MMKVSEVNTPELITQFLKITTTLYKSNKNWTIQLGSDIENVFDSEKNSMFANGDAKRWIVYNEWNIPAGRIAAFYNKSDENYLGGFGFFECIENYECATALLNAAQNWLKEQGCKIMEGPINFGEKDRFWGVLAFGFESPGLYLDNYNNSYYTTYFERFGLVEKDVINTFKVDIHTIAGTRIERIAKRLQEKHQIYFRPFSYEDIDYFATAMHEIYTHSFDEKNRMKYLTINDIIQLLNSGKRVFEGNLIWLAFKDTTPVGLLAFMKDLNQSLALRIKGISDEINLKGFAISVVPEYRMKGVEMGLCNALFNSLLTDGKKYALYFSGINSKTKKMNSFMDSLNASIVKIHKTYNFKIN